MTTTQRSAAGFDPAHLRLLFLADAVAEDLPGGSRTAARELAGGLTEHGHEVTFLVGRQNEQTPEDEIKNGVRILRYAGAGKAAEFICRGRSACRQLLETQSFDLVHTHFAYSAVGPLSALPRSLPKIRTFHGPWDQEGWVEDTQNGDTGRSGTLCRIKAQIKRRVRREIECRSLAGSRKVLTLSRCFESVAQRQYGVGAGRMEMIPGGTDTAAFHVLPAHAADKKALRRALRLPENGQILLSVRRLTPRMGLDKLIQAMPEIAARCPDACLVIGGTGPEEAHLRHLIKALNLETYVHLAGFVPPEKLVSYYQAADLFVLPTLALEGFGLVTTEALSCGLAVVGTPIGATPEILGPLDRRLVARSAEPHCLAEAVVGYLQGEWRQALTPKHLHEYVCQNYTWERHVARTEQVYWDLVTENEKRLPADFRFAFPADSERTLSKRTNSAEATGVHRR